MTKQKRRKRPFENNRKRGRESTGKTGGNAPSDTSWLWGIHAVEAALANPKRPADKLFATANAARKLGLKGSYEVSGGELAKLLPPGAVHQGLALQTAPLPALSLNGLLERKVTRIAVLDQVSDPHNLGAVMRSAAAFGVEAVILQTRHSPPITGIVAKAAAGAVETVAECRVVNIARALETLSQAGFTSIGLAGTARDNLDGVIPDTGPVALVFGAEGTGLRPAVAKACSWLAKIPMSPAMESLNISNAAAIAFYEIARKQAG